MWRRRRKINFISTFSRRALMIHVIFSMFDGSQELFLFHSICAMLHVLLWFILSCIIFEYKCLCPFCVFVHQFVFPCLWRMNWINERILHSKHGYTQLHYILIDLNGLSLLFSLLHAIIHCAQHILCYKFSFRVSVCYTFGIVVAVNSPFCTFASTQVSVMQLFSTTNYIKASVHSSKTQKNKAKVLEREKEKILAWHQTNKRRKIL